MAMDTADIGVAGRWSTWEELLLGGAVLRHGTLNWDIVASEIRTRTDCNYEITPQVCKAKYEDLQQQYSGHTAWFEELRKRRMAELRQALEESENSIGSLELKLESLKAEREDGCQVENDSSTTESLVSAKTPKQVQVESSQRESSKDDFSSGSFSRETSTNCSTQCQLPSVSAKEMETKVDVVESTKQEEDPGFSNLAKLCEQGNCLKKRRGVRKRKFGSMGIKEGSVGESDCVGSVDVLTDSQSKETLTCDNALQRCTKADSNKDLVSLSVDYLMKIFNSVLEHDCAKVFQRRLDDQKKRRYKKLVRQHMDFHTMKSKIMNRSITSAVDFFRDLLLIINNALVFYAKNTQEYKSAHLLRDVACKKLQQHYRKAASETASQKPSLDQQCQNTPAKPPTARPANQKLPGKAARTGNVSLRGSGSQGTKRDRTSDSPSSAGSSAPGKKPPSRSVKGGRGKVNQSVNQSKSRKRVKTR